MEAVIRTSSILFLLLLRSVDAGGKMESANGEGGKAANC